MRPGAWFLMYAVVLVHGCATPSPENGVGKVEAWLATPVPASNEDVPDEIVAEANESIGSVAPLLVKSLSRIKEPERTNALLIVVNLDAEAGKELVRQVESEEPNVQDECLLAIERLYQFNYDKREKRGYDELLDSISAYLQRAVAGPHENVAYRAKHIISRNSIGDH